MFGSGKLSLIADSKFENNFSYSDIVWLQKFDKKVQNLFYALYTELIEKSLTKRGELFNHIRVQLARHTFGISGQKSFEKKKKNSNNYNNNIENITSFLENGSKFFLCHALLKY